jgi:hypothetical protein
MGETQPFGPELEGYRYHLVHAPDSPRRDELQALGAWLQAEMTPARADSAGAPEAARGNRGSPRTGRG